MGTGALWGWPTMMPSQGPDITGLLKRIRSGDSAAENELLSQLYDELRRVAAQYLRRERPGHTLQPTALVNEVLVRLLKNGELRTAPDRRFLFTAIHKAMQRVLVEHARRRIATKRGGAYHRVALDDVLDHLNARWSVNDLELVAIYEALELLEVRSVRQREVVEFKVFGGMNNRQVADELGISEGTVERDFRLARAFLSRQLAG
jgi:RNA polymerase sigma-70 factor (ECF subfamily)